MKGSESRADPASERPSRGGRFLTLLMWVVGVCLSFVVYTVLVNALVPGVKGEAPAPLRSFAAPRQTTVVKIDPASRSVDPGETFSVTVAIENVSDLGGFEFELTYDPSVVTATNVLLGPFLGSTGRSVGELGPTFGTGSLTYGAYSWGANPGPDGDGVLATITLPAINTGASTLHLQNVAAAEPDGAPIPIRTEDGEVIVGPPEVTHITPSSGYTGQVLEDVIVEGNNFQAGASVQLTKDGQSPILAPMPDVQSSTRISCTLNLRNAATGPWNVMVTNRDGRSGTLSNGFTVKEMVFLPVVLRDH